MQLLITETAHRSAAEKTNWRSLQGYVHLWTFPKNNSALQDCFSNKALESHKEHGYFSGPASACLSLIYVLSRWCGLLGRRADLTAKCGRALLSFMRLCQTVSLLQYAALGDVEPDELHASIMRHLEAYKEARGERFFVSFLSEAGNIQRIFHPRV